MASDLYSVQETIEQQQRDNTLHRFQTDWWASARQPT